MFAAQWKRHFRPFKVDVFLMTAFSHCFNAFYQPSLTAIDLKLFQSS